MAKRVILYGTSSCPWCHKTRQFFKEYKIKFKDIDVGTNFKAAQEMIKKSGQQAVPVIDIDGNIIIGYNESKFRELLKIK